jgi:nuclear cap-binding protein subunit 1
LLKCLRLSYHQRVMDIVPETFAGFVPDKPAPNYKYTLEGPLAGSPQTRTSVNVVAAIKRKCSAEELLLVLKVSLQN